MKILNFFVTILFLLCISCSKLDVSNATNPSTSGIKFYGDQYGESLRSFEATTDGGYMFGGYTSTSSNKIGQGFIQKCNKNGILAWSKTYGGGGNEILNAVHPTSDGGFIAAGSTTSYGGDKSYQDMYLVKTDAGGNMAWKKTYSDIYSPFFLYGVELYDARETPDHGFVATGLQNSTAENPLTVVKTSQNGDSVWEKNFIQKNTNQIGTSVALGPNGEVAVAGVVEPFDTEYYFYPTFTYLSPTGALLMPQKTYKNFGSMPWIGNGNTWAYGGINFEKIISKPDGFIFVISTDPQVLANNAPCRTCGVALRVTMFKIDFKGNVLWHQSYGGQGNGVVFNDVANNPDGSLLISGGSTDASGTNYCWLLTTDANGNKTRESFIPVKGYTAWASGAINNGNSFAIGVNLQPLLTNRAGFFGFLTTDLNGKIIENTK